MNSGPYASAILRLQIRFPPSYPDRPPLVTFSTDVFHPLIVPLTTYTFSTGSGVEDPVSAADEGRLPPGGFSLRHGFPHWFKHAKKDTPDATTVTGSMAEQTQAQEVQNIDDDNEKPPRAPTPAHNIPTIPVAELLDYIRSTFDTESILDSLPLEAAGNPGAWHAWRAHRGRRVGRVGFRSASSSAFSSTISTPVSTSKSRHAQSQSPQTRSPGDWHWDGIWANRALDEIKTSRSDVTLFGGMGRGGNGSGSGFSGDDMVCRWFSVVVALSPKLPG